ncbi:cobalamin biosynthesis protein CobD [Novosphingobium sp. PC22D]|uniref:adenosylcobinamide-phosphate synthase CbiB n=1 Tax=Novosphingobium sp. PC22D TaxID=1962403 RepID=UPI000BF1C7B9|nr:adenosylcobinamide-phosphate synthase CbiB [Novosphingobium sp. PC22D]PEQ13673.1 cobalamin biosynthesis protein CobD [Novosphingobium sp. PC22D]
MTEPVALLALGIEAAIGWPQALYRRAGHPVGLFARTIARLDARWNDPARSDRARRLLGVATVAIVVTATSTAAFGVELALRRLPPPWSWIGLALAAWPALAQRGLFEHVRPVADRLHSGDLGGARDAVARIVGRDTQGLDEAGVARAAIESLAESFCDGVAAPLFWLVVAGLPGLWAYKAINTADSLIGHKEAPYRMFGWAAARIDDLANLVPARVAACLLCLAGARGWATMRRDARRHASPNAGWTEAAMAGALGVRLAGPVRYEGVLHDKPWIGTQGRDARPRDIDRALAVYVRACALLWLLAALAAWEGTV